MRKCPEGWSAVGSSFGPSFEDLRQQWPMALCCCLRVCCSCLPTEPATELGVDFGNRRSLSVLISRQHMLTVLWCWETTWAMTTPFSPARESSSGHFDVTFITIFIDKCYFITLSIIINDLENSQSWPWLAFFISTICFFCLLNNVCFLLLAFFKSFFGNWLVSLLNTGGS